MKKLFRITGALPYLAVVFLNAFVDLGHKITIQNTIFKVYDGNTQVILTAVVNGLILLPFILFFSPAGYIADRHPKSTVMRLAAWMALVLTLGITFCYYQGWFIPAFAMTFLLAIQSAVYSPAKYGYIKNLFGRSNLAEANGRVQATTIAAILLGTFAFSILFENWFPAGADTSQGLRAIAPIGWLLVAISALELIMAYRLPMLENGNPQEQFDMRDYLTGKSVVKNVQPILGHTVIRLSVLGLAVFWSVGQVMLAAFPAFAKETLAVTNTIVIQGILAATGIGIAIGSSLAARWSKGHIETGLIPVGAIGIGAGLMLLPQLQTTTAHFINFLFIGVMGGLFIVPLNALIQFSARNDEMGKVIAGNNLFQNISMLGFLVLTALFAVLGLSSRLLLIIIAGVAVVGGLYTVLKLPHSLIRIVLTALMTRRYRVAVQGVNNIPAQGGALLLGNHISWIDWAIVQIATPRPIRFVMLKSIYQRWYLQWFLDLVGCIPIESGANSKQSLEIVAELLDKGEVVCLFPEGAISRTGHLGEFRRGFERACALTNSDVPVIPFYLRGLWGSQFSRSSTQSRELNQDGLHRDVIVAFGKPLHKDVTADVLKRKVFDLSVIAWDEYADSLPTLSAAWIESAKRSGNKLAIADTRGNPLNATQALAATLSFSKRIRQYSQTHTVGILLPTSAGAAITNMAALFNSNTVVNLNYSASTTAIQSAIEQADVQTVYTSRRFLKMLASNKGIDLAPALEQVDVIFLEDLTAEIGKLELLGTWLMVKMLPAKLLTLLFCRANKPEHTAAILFSSGSEGAPKGICLSHRNIMANLRQTADVLNVREDDAIMASLPFFHAFGLTATLFMPLIDGLPMICHADPTDAQGIAKAIAKYRATVLCSTSTFLRLFTRNKKIHPLMLDSLRIVVSGAEKLNPEIRDAFQSKFNKVIYEGYGATETSPVASVNLPDALDTSFWKVQVGSKPGTVGMPLPGTSFKIIDPETEQELPTGEAGMILIGGQQVMQGYLNNPEKTAEVIRDIDGQRWYVTGDKGYIDASGFLTIIDRYSRFAKIGGEMISLSAVETAIEAAAHDCLQQQDDTLPEAVEFVAINIPDDKKGEAIIMLHTSPLDADKLKQCAQAAELNPLMIPSRWLQVDAIPKLGSGKTDFGAAREMVSEA